MGGNTLGLTFEINADSAQAEAAMARFQESAQAMVPTWEQVGVSANEAGKKIVGAGEEGGKSLLGAHQATHLLAEEMGIHLPRAVVGAISEMLPSVAELGGALLAVFAVKEMYHWAEEGADKIREVFRDADDEVERLDAAAAAAFKHMKDEAGKIFTDFKTTDAGAMDIAEIDDRAKKLVEYHDAYVKWEATGKRSLADFTSLGAATMRVIAEAKKEGLNDLAETDQKLNEIGQLQFAAHRRMAELTAKDEKDATEAAMQVLRKHQEEVRKAAHEEEQAARHLLAVEKETEHLHAEANKAFQKQAVDDLKVKQEDIALQKELNAQEMQFLGIIGQLNSAQQQGLAREAGINQALSLHEVHTKHLSMSTLLYVGTLQTLRVNAEAAKQAMVGLTEGMIQTGVAAAMSGQNIGKALLQTLKSTLVSIASESAVRAIYDFALGLHYSAEGNFPAAALAYSAAEVFGTVALAAGVGGAAIPNGGGGGGSYGAGRSAGPGGNQSDYGSGGGGGSGGGSGPGGGGGGRGPTIIWHQYGPPGNMADFARTLTQVQNQLVGSGQIKVIATTTRTKGPTST